MRLLGTVFLLGSLSTPVFAEDSPSAGAESASQKNELGALLKKLADPTSDVWALFWEQDWTFSEGDFSNGSRRTGKQSIFQPIMPWEWSENWKLLTRPTLPIMWSHDIPTGRRYNGSPIGSGSAVILRPDGSTTFESKEGIGDFTIPMMFSPKKPADAKWGWGLGPSLVFPTGSNDSLTQHTFQAGPAALVTYKTKTFTGALLGQYWWDYADTGSSNVGSSHGSLLYSLWWNRPNAWQIGMNPTITYNDKAAGGSDNKWNVPIGGGVAKMIAIGNTPVKIQFAIEKSIVREDDYGLDWNIRLNIIPVILSPQKKPFFGN
ncbi:MAG: hypothetical protein ACR2QB_06640 [Gammaproteobacteria bacterium]